MPTYLTSVNHPQVGAQNFIYDTVSGYYRTMLDTDFTNSGAVTKLNTIHYERIFNKSRYY